MALGHSHGRTPRAPHSSSTAARLRYTSSAGAGMSSIPSYAAGPLTLTESPGKTLTGYGMILPAERYSPNSTDKGTRRALPVGCGRG
ncbi:hypothetical protein BDV30DRAFT_206748 [Aspergillus minisclerotigenes]|uniref:Uncharacterized protein n=1 Tax=Aspergillus minisclerotigenes TaxID=656917 RepID=A0A5N6JE72_9EURO|nr:hypothetical protein BDV30DRAFT_206748 [Aspergillus minisclerotigenes]